MQYNNITELGIIRHNIIYAHNKRTKLRNNNQWYLKVLLYYVKLANYYAGNSLADIIVKHLA